MRTLIYKRTHLGDPDPILGVFGNADCMGRVRGYSYDAVIGVGGLGNGAVHHRIARKLTWVGIGPQKTGDSRRPLVTFDHFLYFGEGLLLETLAPALARHMYSRKARWLLDAISDSERQEVENILEMAKGAPPSRARIECIPRQAILKSSGDCSCQALLIETEFVEA